MCGKNWDGFGMMQIESRKKTGRKQKVVRKKLGWMLKGHGYDEEMIRNDSRKEAERKQKGSEKKGGKQK